MPSLIHFRSRFEGSHITEGGTRKNHGRSSEIHGIRTYNLGDDPRDIVWKRGIEGENLYIKEREESLHPEVILISKFDANGYRFYTDDSSKTKEDFYRELERDVIESARKIRFPFHVYTDSTLKKPPEKCIMLILCDIDNAHMIENISQFSKKNDIILIMLEHPEETMLHRGSIFESRVVGKRYLEERGKYIQHIEQEASLHGISFLQCTTEDAPSLLLNHFFKYRYV